MHFGLNSLELSVCLTLAFELACIAWLFMTTSPPSPLRPVARRAWQSIATLSVLVLLFTNAQQIANIDDDYWIHAPLQGLMRSGNFPPFNPYFADLPMIGHYGRNLAIASFSFLSGCDVFLSQHLLTSALQLTTLWLFFATFWRNSGRWQTALLGTGFLFFGINAGGRAGLMDTLQNNNAFVHLYLALLLSLTVEVWKNGSRAAVILGGLCLGSYAVVYETHFGLTFLTIVTAAIILWARGLIGKKQALASLAILVVATPLALTQGGPLTKIAHDALHRTRNGPIEKLSKGMQNQSQALSIGFPKKELFQILLEPGEYQRVSHIYTLNTPLKLLHSPTSDRGYAYIWSWAVLKIHFLPLYLLPFSIVILWRRGSFEGLFLGVFGAISYLTPALVNFGPIYESEYYRWEFAASLGFAGALGLALGSWLERKQSPPFAAHNGRLFISQDGVKISAVCLIALINSWAGLHFVCGRLSSAFQQAPNSWLVFPSTQDWLARHRVLNFDDLDDSASTWLQKAVRPGDRLLTNFDQENNFSILFESTLTGLTGARCVGHALPIDKESIGTTPFRRAPAAVLFWETFRGEPLRQLEVNWVYYRNDDGQELPPLPGAQLVHRVQQGRRLRLIYKIDPSRLPDLKAPAQTSKTPALAARLKLPQTALRGGRVCTLSLEIDGQGSKKLSGVLELSTRREDGAESPPSEALRLRLGSDSQTENVRAVPFVPPYNDGLYDLVAQWFPDPGVTHLNFVPEPFLMDFDKILAQITVTSMSLPDQPLLGEEIWPARTLLIPTVTLKLPEKWPQTTQLLACWAFYSSERGEFDLVPGINLQTVDLSSQPLRLPLITPERPGRYSLGLYLSSDQTRQVHIPVREISVGDLSE